MRGEHAGGELRIFVARRGVDSLHRTDDCFDLFPAQSARPQQDGEGTCHVEHGRFDADGTRATVEDVINPRTQLIGDVLSRRGADVAEEIGARRGHRSTSTRQKIEC